MKCQSFIKRWDKHFIISTLLICLFSAITANAEATTINNTNNISAAKADSIIAAIENKLDKTQYGFYNIVCKDGYTLNYRLFKPASTPNEKYPLVITLPGSGSEGTNNTTQMGGVGASLWGQPEYQVLHPHYSVVPQPSALIPDSNWKNSYAYEYKQLRDTLIRMYPDIDTTRIYLTGFSAGASMVYRMLGYFPTSFAAGVPGDGAIGGAHEGYEAMGIWPEIYVKNNTPMWMFNGGTSDAVKPDQINGMNNIADSISLHGGNPRTTNMPNLNHAEVEGMYKLEPGLFEWLFAQKREVLSASINAMGPTTICEGDSVLLTAGTASSYLWNTGEKTQSIEVKTSGDYFVTITNSNGNSATSNVIAITVIPLPIAKIIPNGKTEFCEGDSVVLNAQTADEYLWSTGEKTQSIVAKISAKYSVIVTNSNGCSAISSVIEVFVYDLPSVPTITAEGNLLISSSTTGNQWYLDGKIIEGAVFQTYEALSEGIYTVETKNTNGCLAISAQYDYKGQGIEEMLFVTDLVIVPNPAYDYISIQGSFEELTIYDMLGREVETIKKGSSGKIDISFLKQGIYIIKSKNNICKFVKI